MILIKHNGFHVPDHQESIARMQLRPNLTLEIENETKPISKQTILDESQEPVNKVLSRHTRTIDSWLSINDKSRGKQVVLLPFDRRPEIVNPNDKLFISSSPTKTKIDEHKENKIENTKAEELVQKQANQKEIQNRKIHQINEEEEEEAEFDNQSINDKSLTNEEQAQPKETSIPNYDTDLSHRRRLIKKFGYFTAEPCSYTPNFDAIYPTIPVSTMQSREIPPPSPPIEVFSSAEVASMYNSNLRDFDTKKVSIKKYQELDVQYPNEKLNTYDYMKVKEVVDSNPSSNNDSTIDSNIHSPRSNHSNLQTTQSKMNNNEKLILKQSAIFVNKVPRDEIFRNYSPSKHLAPGQYDIPEPKAPATLDMSKLHDREFPVTPDPNRVYPLAIEQADKLKPKKPFHVFSKDTSREIKKQKNSRIELLDKLKQDRKELMKELMPLARNASRINSRPKTRNGNIKNSRTKDIENIVEENIQNWKAKTSMTPKKKSQFDIQSSRPQDIWPGQKNHANDRDPVYPFDPIQSFKNTRPKSRVIELRNKPKPLEGPDFWKKTWIGT